MARRAKFEYEGTRAAMDGNTAVIMCERESTDGAGAYPITPSTQMGEYWAEATAAGHLNISGRPLIFIEPEGEHAAAAITAGLSMTGLRASNFSSGQGIAYMHESLYAAVGKRLTYVLNIGARAMTKATLNVHAGHDDYHCIDDTGFFQVFAKNAQQAADFNIIAHHIAELALTPGVVAQDGFLTTHLIESLLIPERELIAEYLGRPDDIIETPTAAQRIIYGPTRRRIPELWDVDNPVMAGVVQNQDSYMQTVAAQRPFFFDHIREITDQALEKFFGLTGRRYGRVESYRAEDADYLIFGQGSLIPSAEVVADYLRETRKLKVGVVNLSMFRPFPGDLIAELIRGKKGVAVLERLDQPLASDLPMIREVRATISKCLENGRGGNKKGDLPYPQLPTYRRLDDAPPLYSGSFGLGSRDLQPEGLIGAVENMLPEAARKKLFYLSIDFVRSTAMTPKQEIYQQTIAESYPEVQKLAVHGSENPNLMPAGSITVRFHSVGGWGAITTGKNLAMTLFDLLGYYVKANPKYGSEKKGQPTTYYLSAAPEPIRINCEYFYVDVVLSPDPNAFHHTDPLAGLKEGGTFVIQSDGESPEKVWASFPPGARKTIVDKKIRVFYLDAFAIARHEATDSDLQLRMQGIAFQGAFFAASPVMEQAGMDESTLIAAIESQLDHKFGSKGARVVADNKRVVRRGFLELQEIVDKPLEGFDPAGNGAGRLDEPAIPIMVKREPQGKAPATDLHRFWEQTGSFYARGMGSDSISDPFIGLGCIPAASAHFRDMTGIRFEHPEWIPENCTACGDCYTICPDTAIPGLVSDVSQVFDTVVQRVRKTTAQLDHLPRATRTIEKHLRRIFGEAKETDPIDEMLTEAIEETVKGSDLGGDELEALKSELSLFQTELDGFKLALSRPYWTVPEKREKGSGGLISITINPYTCKGCMECVEVCNDDALRPQTQTADSVARLRKDWDFWLDLPTTPRKYLRVDDLEQGIGALETILLDKGAYQALTSGDGACLGCAEKTVIHLFIATVESLMQPRIERHLTKLDELIAKLEKHIQLRLVAEVDVKDTDEMAAILAAASEEKDLTLADIAGTFEKDRGGTPIDREWLLRVNGLLAKLKNLRWRYSDGTSGKGRAKMGMINATGCTSVWGSTFPFNPYPFPWANHLFQDSPSMAMGVFEGHMAKMAEGFRAIRMVELELAGTWDAAVHQEELTYFDWHDFTDEEFELCPPVVSVGGDGAMYDIGFQNLSRAMMSGKPIKVIVVDTQVYSNTGGQACTSGFLGQISDMAQFGKVQKGKQEVRKEIGLIGMAHRTTFVAQSTAAHANHLIEGFVKGLQTRRPALFNCYTSCQPEHGIGDDMSAHQAKLAVESRAYPLFRYDPDAGSTPTECFDLSGNPGIGDLWPTYRLEYRQGGRTKEMELPMTFADFALTEVRFRKHFRHAPRDTWHDEMVPLAEFLQLEAEDRDGLFPFVWVVDKKQELGRLLVDSTIVASCEERADFWGLLRSLAGLDREVVDEQALEAKVRARVIGNIANGLAKLAAGVDGDALAALSAGEGLELETSLPVQPALPPSSATGDVVTGQEEVEAEEGEGPVAPWLETELCTTCDECININPQIFAYNDRRKAYIKNAEGGPYEDLVKAAEKCTATVIHPGVPKDRTGKGIEKWIKRAAKYN